MRNPRRMFTRRNRIFSSTNHHQGRNEAQYETQEQRNQSFSERPLYFHPFPDQGTLNQPLSVPDDPLSFTGEDRHTLCHWRILRFALQLYNSIFLLLISLYHILLILSIFCQSPCSISSIFTNQTCLFCEMSTKNRHSCYTVPIIFGKITCC